MSAIYFHGEGERLRVSGCERAHFGNLCHQMLCASIGSLLEIGGERHWLRKLLPADHYLQRCPAGPEFERSVPTALRGDLLGLHLRMPTGEQLEPWTLGLNTALALGGDALKLVARLHGQCEIHAWVEGRNRSWLAGLIEKGARDGIFRREMGWEKLIPWLRSSSDGAVVTSYSVCEGFPGWDSEKDASKEWATAVAELRVDGGGVELTPEHWAWPDFHFGAYKVTGFHLEELASSTIKLADLLDRDEAP